MNMPLKLFLIGVRQMLRDGMLLVLVPAPFLMAAVLRFGFPAADAMIGRNLGFSIEAYYPLGDALLIIMTPMMAAMVFAFLILEDRDEGTGIYFSITPAGGRAYLVARLGIPMLWAFASSTVACGLFGLSQVRVHVLLIAILIGTLQSASAGMLLVAFARNKVEGLALSKLAGLFMLGLFSAWFLPEPQKYLLSLLPSFWVAELLRAPASDIPSLGSAMAGVVTSLLWMVSLIRVFLQRLA